jgi:hypothetical protein
MADIAKATLLTRFGRGRSAAVLDSSTGLDNHEG